MERQGCPGILFLIPDSLTWPINRGASRKQIPISDLINLNGELRVALEKNIITQGGVAEAMAKSKIKADALFDTKLKAAETKGDFDKIILSITDMGVKGDLSGEQVVAKFKEIADKAGTRLNLDLVEDGLNRVAFRKQIPIS